MQGTPVAPPPQAPMTGPILIVHYGGNDDDHASQHYQSAVAHAHTAHRISWLVWVIVVIVVSLGGSGAAFMRCANHSTFASSLVWSGSEPLMCSGNENIAVSGVTATFNAGTAIRASGNCHVRCTDCTLSAPTAIEAGGNAEVIIVNGSVKGTTLLADASGNARITIMGNVTASGPSKQSGNAKVSAPATAAPPPAPAPIPAPPAAKAAPKKR